MSVEELGTLERAWSGFRMVGGTGTLIHGSQARGYAVEAEDCLSRAVTVTSTGACCVGADCSILSADDCATATGAYQGDGTLCDPNPCSPPTGACCYPCASPFSGNLCDDGTLSTDCESNGGIFQGDGTLCSSFPPTNETCITTLSITAIVAGNFVSDGGACDYAFGFTKSTTYTRMDATFDGAGHITNEPDPGTFFMIRHCGGARSLIVAGGANFAITLDTPDAPISVTCSGGSGVPCRCDTDCGQATISGELSFEFPSGIPHGIEVGGSASVFIFKTCPPLFSGHTPDFFDTFSAVTEVPTTDCNLCEALGTYHYSGTNFPAGGGSIGYDITVTIA